MIANGMLKSTGERWIYATGIDKDKNVHNQHVRRYNFACEHIAGGKTLDCGCGDGYGAWRAAQISDVAIGLDISPQAINYATRYYIYPNLLYCVMDIADLKFGDNIFDMIISFEFIEHTLYYMEALSEMKRVLKHDGKLFISTPNKAIRKNGEKWRWHTQEWHFEEFKELTNQYFNNSEWFGQTPSGDIVAPFVDTPQHQNIIGILG